MPFTFRRRITLIPGFLTANINRRSVSFTGRVGRVSHTRSSSGRRTTSVNLPGRGLGYRTTSTRAARAQEDEQERTAQRDALRARLDAALARREARRAARRGRGQ